MVPPSGTIFALLRSICQKESVRFSQKRRNSEKGADLCKIQESLDK